MLINQLFDFCKQKKTGTVFIVTVENKACHIVLEQGRLIGLNYNRLKGDAVIPLLMQMEVTSISFKEMIFPMPNSAKVTSSDAALKILGFEPDAPTMAEESERKRKQYRGIDIDENKVAEEARPLQDKDVVYRGQSIKRDKAPDLDAEQKTKKVRMYRGQPIKD